MNKHLAKYGQNYKNWKIDTFRARKAFSSKRGLFFTVKGPRALPKFHTDPPPPRPSPPPLLETPHWDFQFPPRSCGEGRGGGTVWNLGSAQGPFTVKKRPLFDENALRVCSCVCLACAGWLGFQKDSPEMFLGTPQKNYKPYQ